MDTPESLYLPEEYENVFKVADQSFTIALQHLKNGFTTMKESWSKISIENKDLRMANKNQKAFDMIVAENEEKSESNQVLLARLSKLQKEIDVLKEENTQLKSVENRYTGHNQESNHLCVSCGKLVEKIFYCNINCLQSYL